MKLGITRNAYNKGVEDTKERCKNDLRQLIKEHEKNVNSVDMLISRYFGLRLMEADPQDNYKKIVDLHEVIAMGQYLKSTGLSLWT